MEGFERPFSHPTIPKMLKPALVLLVTLLTARTVSAQVITTIPDVVNGVNNNSFATGTGNSASVAITTTQPRNGNGSLELRMTNFAQPAVIMTSPSFAGTSLAALTSLSFDYLGTNVVNTSPTIRTFSSVMFQNAARTINLGWYANSGAAEWTNSGNLINVASSADGSTGFFLRILGGGSGQLDRNCVVANVSGGFDDRRQSLADWLSACNGSAGRLNLAGVLVSALQVDQGRWPGFTGDNVSYVDNVSINATTLQSAVTYNFETSVGVVPEPSTYALMGAGLAAMGLVARRRRRQA